MYKSASNTTIRPIQLQLLHKKQSLYNMRKRAREENTPINAVYDDQLVEISMDDNADDALSQLPSLESLRSSLYRARHKTIRLCQLQEETWIFLTGFSGGDFLFVMMTR